MATDDTDPRFQRMELPLEGNTVPTFEAALRYWNDLRADAFAPGWRDFDLMQIPAALLPYTIVADLHLDQGYVGYRYYGSGMAELHGFELTGKTSNDLQPPGLRAHIVAQYREVAEARRPLLFATDIVVKQGIRMRHLVFRLPLSNDGETVSNVVTFEDVGDHHHDLQKYFAAQSKAARR